MTFTKAVGFLSVLAILAYRVIPLYGMWRLFKTGDIRPIPVLLYFTTLLSTTFWTVYGIQIHIWEIWVIMPLYLTLYLYFLPGCSGVGRLTLIILLYAFTNSLVFFSYYVLSEDINGAIASSLSFLVQTSQVFTIVQVLSTQNNIYIDIALMYSFASTNILNTLYGILINRIYWWLSMLWGLIFNIILIVLYYQIETNPNTTIIEEFEDRSDFSDNCTDDGSVLGDIGDNWENEVINKPTSMINGMVNLPENILAMNESIDDQTKFIDNKSETSDKKIKKS